MISGLPRESACFRSIPVPERDFATFAGVGPRRAAEGARAFVARGVQALMSFGVAGGLSPDARAGTMVLATSVVVDDEHYSASSEWSAAIRKVVSEIQPIIEAPLAGADRMIPSPEAKKDLHRETGAVACDMESHAVARVAREADIPFIVIRTISDPVDRHVPKWVLKSLTPEGDVRVAKLLANISIRPWAVPNLVGLSRDSGKAFDGLRRVAGLLGGGLGFPVGRP